MAQSYKTQWIDETIYLLPRYQSKTEIKDRGTPPADSTMSPAMADAKDTQPGSMETPLADATTVPLAEIDAGTQKDVPTAWATSPAKFKNQVTPTTWSVDKLAGPPTLSGHMVKERQKYPQWIKVHSSKKVATVGVAPYKSREPRQCHNCSSK